MNNQEILDSAPDGATHYMGKDCFFPFIKLISGVSHAYNFKVCKWLKLEKMLLSIDSRSLADIKLIVELEQVEPAMDRLMEEKRKRIVELEKALYKLIDQASLCDSWECFPSDWLDEAYKSLTKGGAE